MSCSVSICKSLFVLIKALHVAVECGSKGALVFVEIFIRNSDNGLIGFVGLAEDRFMRTLPVQRINILGDINVDVGAHCGVGLSQLMQRFPGLLG